MSVPSLCLTGGGSYMMDYIYVCGAAVALAGYSDRGWLLFLSVRRPSGGGAPSDQRAPACGGPSADTLLRPVQAGPVSCPSALTAPDRRASRSIPQYLIHRLRLVQSASHLCADWPRRINVVAVHFAVHLCHPTRLLCSHASHPRPYHIAF